MEDWPVNSGKACYIACRTGGVRVTFVRDGSCRIQNTDVTEE
jgi:hypothetical protein